jgi:hypothetical protein
VNQPQRAPRTHGLAQAPWPRNCDAACRTDSTIQQTPTSRPDDLPALQAHARSPYKRAQSLDPSTTGPLSRPTGPAATYRLVEATSHKRPAQRRNSGHQHRADCQPAMGRAPVGVLRCAPHPRSRLARPGAGPWSGGGRPHHTGATPGRREALAFVANRLGTVSCSVCRAERRARLLAARHVYGPRRLQDVAQLLPLTMVEPSIFEPNQETEKKRCSSCVHVNAMV